MRERDWTVVQGRYKLGLALAGLGALYTMGTMLVAMMAFFSIPETTCAQFARRFAGAWPLWFPWLVALTLGLWLMHGSPKPR